MKADAEKNRELILALAAKKIPAKKIARRLKLHAGTVWRHLSAAGIKPESSRCHSKLSDRERVLAMVAEHGVAKTAKKLRTSRQAVYQRCKQWLEQPA